MGKGLLYCEKRDTDCMEIYMGNGACRRSSCVLDDPEYQKKRSSKRAAQKRAYRKGATTQKGRARRSKEHPHTEEDERGSSTGRD